MILSEISIRRPVLTWMMSLAIILFGVTSGTPGYTFLGPHCATRTVVNPGFDPWTGEPYGRTYECIDILADEPSTRLVTDEAPDDLIGRPVVPLPLGFALGALIALIWLTARSITEADRRRPWNREATSR